MLVGQGQQLLLKPGELVTALDLERAGGRTTTSHGKSLARRGGPGARADSARQPTLAVPGAQTGSRDSRIEGEGHFCKIVWGVLTPPWGVPRVVA